MIHPDQLAELLKQRLTSSKLTPEQVADFCNSSPSTIRDWIDGKKPPRGQRLNYLWWLLATIGFESPELDEIPEFGRYIGELLAFDVIDIEEAQDLCGINYEQGVLGATRGSRSPAAPKHEIDELKSEYGEKLQDGRDRKLRLIPPSAYESVPESEEPQPNASTVAATAALYPHELARLHLVTEAAAELGRVLPWANLLVSEEFSPQERAMVRELLGGDVVFVLANALNRLCSERANNQGR